MCLHKEGQKKFRRVSHPCIPIISEIYQIFLGVWVELPHPAVYVKEAAFCKWVVSFKMLVCRLSKDQATFDIYLFVEINLKDEIIYKKNIAVIIEFQIFQCTRYPVYLNNFMTVLTILDTLWSAFSCLEGIKIFEFRICCFF